MNLLLLAFAKPLTGVFLGAFAFLAPIRYQTDEFELERFEKNLKLEALEPIEEARRLPAAPEEPALLPDTVPLPVAPKDGAQPDE